MNKDYLEHVTNQACVVRLPKGFPLDDFAGLARNGLSWRVIDANEQDTIVRFSRDFPLKELFDFAKTRNWQIVWRQPDMQKRENPRLYDAEPVEKVNHE
jgi:hypothetical protein